MRLLIHLIPFVSLFPALFSSLFAPSQTTCSPHHINDNDDNSSLCQLHQFQLKIDHLESVLAESIQNLTEKIDRIEEREKRIDDMAQKIHHLQSVLSTLKGDSLATDERLKALEEEVRLLWTASRKYNFDLHVLESKAQDTEDRLQTVASQAQKMADVVTEQWIQIQRLEQALHITQFINNLSDDPLLKTLGPNFRSYFSRALHQFKRVFAEFKRSHHELQHFIKEKLEKNEFTAALANEELVFFMASALITFPVMSAWMLLSSKLTS
ncbi:hypothetical protein PRUPE_3G304000 [Prunus persica]|uniref:Uncharacterized protein n=2 Tax=Prunus persica TaxID=3760 RepID=A0A251QB52_PRUPE|nr:hypothetical protein PRUPE_3G304000 [Prunus persica]